MGAYNDEMPGGVGLTAVVVEDVSTSTPVESGDKFVSGITRMSKVSEARATSADPTLVAWDGIQRVPARIQDATARQAARQRGGGPPFRQSGAP